MSNMQPVRGTKDLFPEDYYYFNKVIEAAKKCAELYCYLDLQTPIIEYTEVFARSLGETSDVISKEMYSFASKGGESLTMRPEFTAGIIRAVTSGGMVQHMPMKLFSHGPLFRYDRPQAGRQRQFHQINFEMLGLNAPEADGEIIKLAFDVLERLGLKNHVQLLVNSLGCADSRADYHSKLKSYLMKYENELSIDSQKRLHKNPMRILDSKDENDIKILREAPLISESYTKDTQARFEKVLNTLTLLGVVYQIDHKLVRGLDYYCHTAFEFTTEILGSKLSVAGGGRYDGLAKIMSRYDFPAIGFAAGVERLILMYQHLYPMDKAVMNNINAHLGIIAVEEEFSADCYKLADMLRNSNVATQVYSSGKMGKKIEKAEKCGAKFVVFLGGDEIKSNKYKIKNLETGDQKEIILDDLLKFNR